MEKRTRFGLDKLDAELVNDILPIGINLPKNQKNLLAILIHINGIDEKDNEGYFYVDNQYLMNVLEVSEPTLIANANKLISKGFIIRKSGKKHHPSKYLVTDLIKDFSETNTKELGKYTKDLSGNTKDFSETNTKNLSKRVKNFSQDKEQDKDIDKEKDKEEILNIIINKIEDNNNNLINILKKEIKKEIENIKEKESYSSIESEKQSSINENKGTNEIETMKELIEKINTLQEENSKLNERLNNCARQFKQMMERIGELEAKVNKTSNEDKTSTENQEKSHSKPSIDVDCILPHAKEEKPTVAQQMPSTAIVEDEVTPKEDVDVNEVMKVFADVVKQYEEQKKERCNECALNTFKAMILQDLDDKKADNSKRKEVEERINNYINNYKGKTILSHSIASINQQPSTTVEEERKDCAEKKEDTNEVISSTTANDNDSTLPTTKEEEEKSVDCSEMPLNEKKLRYLDTMTDKQYSTEQEAQKDGANPWFLYDWKVGRCITEYTSPSSPSNVDDGIVAHANEEKPTVLQQMPSTAIVEDNSNQEKEEKAVEKEKKHIYFSKVATLTDEILDELKKNYSTSECLKLFKIDWANHTIQSKTSRDILGYGEESKELRDMIAMDSKEGKRLMKMVAIGV